MTIALVCGGRDYDDARRVAEVLEGIAPSVVITGAASGADSLASAWARRNAQMLIEVPALWDVHGRGAGPKRNGKSPRVVVVAFPGGRGTADMVSRARRAGVEVADGGRREEGPDDRTRKAQLADIQRIVTKNRPLLSDRAVSAARKMGASV